MNISIDVRHLAHGPLTGVGVVTYALLDALRQAMPQDAFTLLFSGRRGPPDALRAVANARNVTLVSSRIPNRLLDAVASFGLPPLMRSVIAGSDVHLSPHMLPVPATKTPRVLVLHDLSFVRYPELYSPRSRAWHARMRPRIQAARAHAIVVPSLATKRDVEELWPDVSSRVHIVPWGTPDIANMPNLSSQTANDEAGALVRRSPSGRRRPSVRRSPSGRRRPSDLGLPDRTCHILFLGTVEIRKNVLALLRAFRALEERAGRGAYRLTIAGAAGWGSAAVRREMKNLQYSAAVRMTGYVTESEKLTLIADADVFVYPSLYEGSGLPVLEAMAAGVPCVVSNRTALPEVVGTAAVLVDPERPDEIADAIALLVGDRTVAEVFSERGRSRATELTWQKTASQVAEVLRQVARQP